MRAKTERTLRIMIPVLAILIFVSLVISRLLRYKSFEGEIVGISVEWYSAPEESRLSIPFLPDVSYEVRRIRIKSKKGRILDLAMHIGNLEKKSIGKKLKGSYKRGRFLEIKGNNVIFGFIDFPGPKIELRGEPDGVIKKYEILTSPIKY